MYDKIHYKKKKKNIKKKKEKSLLPVIHGGACIY